MLNSIDSANVGIEPGLRLSRASVDYPIRNQGGSSRFADFARSVGGTFVEHEKRRFVRALNGVNINLRNGDRVGLLGGNGSGKSTLLKTLAGILPLATGTRAVSGRIATLFSTGVGIDNERTGAENIVRMAALYNVPKRQVPALIDEIAEFTELGEFIDLPVKSYSSGMNSRLGFGLVTSISANIILVDEVIGTGDKNFHEKARLRLEQFLSDRGIVVIASHSNKVLQSLCTTGIVLQRGSIAFSGPIDDAAAFYNESKPNQRKPAGA